MYGIAWSGTLKKEVPFTYSICVIVTWQVVLLCLSTTFCFCPRERATAREQENHAAYCVNYELLVIRPRGQDVSIIDDSFASHTRGHEAKKVGISTCANEPVLPCTTMRKNTTAAGRGENWLLARFTLSTRDKVQKKKGRSSWLLFLVIHQLRLLLLRRIVPLLSSHAWQPSVTCWKRGVLLKGKVIRHVIVSLFLVAKWGLSGKVLTSLWLSRAW